MKGKGLMRGIYIRHCDQQTHAPNANKFFLTVCGNWMFVENCLCYLELIVASKKRKLAGTRETHLFKAVFFRRGCRPRSDLKFQGRTKATK